MLIKERIGKKSLFEIDPQNRYELGNIRDLNFLTVNYLQRKALINDIKMFEDVTEAIKEIKSYILEKSDFASELFPTIPSTQPIIPEFFADLKKSEFMSQICNENHSEIQKENNIVKQDPSRYFYFKLLMFSISVSGNHAPHILSVFHKDFNSNILSYLCDSLLGDEAAWVHYKFKNIDSDFLKKKISATDYGLYNKLLAGDIKKLLLTQLSGMD